MKKWIERLITAAGIATLVGIFCYQVAYGHTASWGYGKRLQSNQKRDTL
jgi:hypothetical protein